MSLFTTVRRNLATARFSRHELAGSLGDLGTFLPVLLALSQRAGLDFATGLLFAGLCNVLTGLVFSIPMAVQPMKAIAAVALAEGLNAGQIVAAGAIVGAIVLLLGVTGLVDRLARAIPRSVVRGVQLGLGLALVIQAMKLVASTGEWLAPDGYLTAVGGALAALWLSGERTRVPGALVIFAAGLGLAVWREPGVFGALQLGFTLPDLMVPSVHDLLVAAERAALPQLPLTLLNSVVAVCVLATELYPDRVTSPRRVAMSVGLMNLCGMWFGAMPLCHGAGGLAAQHRFGARTNGAILFLGGAKVALALVFGSSLLALCHAFPASLLGVLLAFSGLELALVAAGRSERNERFVTLATAGVSLGLGNAAVGVAVGLGLALWARWRGRGR